MNPEIPPANDPAQETPHKTFPLSEAEYAMRAARYLFEKDASHTKLISCLDAGLEYLATLERDLAAARTLLKECRDFIEANYDPGPIPGPEPTAMDWSVSGIIFKVDSALTGGKGAGR